MKVLQIGTQAFGKGGVGNYISSIISGSLGEDVSFVVGLDESRSINPPDNGQYVIVPYKVEYRWTQLLNRVYQLKRIVRKHSVNVIHVHTQRTALVVAIAKKLGLPVRVLYTPHGFRHTQLKGFKKVLHLIVEKLILHTVDRVVAITDIELKEFPMQQHKFIKIKSYVNLPCIGNASESNGSKSDRKTIIMVGSVTDRKNPDLFINVAEALSSNQALFFRWIGSGDLEVYAKETTVSKGLNNIEFCGQKSQSELSIMLDKSDILLMTSKAEGFPLSILEAYQKGLLVVCNDFLGAREIVDDGKTGLIFDYNSTEAAVKCLIEIINLKQAEASSIILNSQKFVEAYTDINRFASDYIRAYRSLA